MSAIPIKQRLDDNSKRDPDTGCRLWMGYRDPDGYARLRVDGASLRCHRLAWAEANGPIPDGMYILHKCDVRTCINPAHLFLGTHADNMRDMTEKGRRAITASGVMHHAAKLTDEIVRAIRADPRRRREIGAEYGLSDNHVGRIKLRQSWRHLP